MGQNNTSNNEQTLRNFQYRAYIKTVNILLPNYKYRHTTELDPTKKFVGRKEAEKKLLSYLTKTGKKGAYLITGYRGMGKTSLVNTVTEQLTKDDKSLKKISISFGQKNISEIDILRQIVFEIKLHLESSGKPHWLLRSISNPHWWLQLTSNPMLPLVFGVICFFLPFFIGIKDTRLCKIQWLGISKFFEVYKIEGVLGWLVVSSLFAVLLSVIFSLFGRMGARILGGNHRRLHKDAQHLYDRCSSQYTAEESTGTGAEQFPIILSRKRSKAYPIAGPKEISNEIIHLINALSKKWGSLKFIFVFDELDKIDSSLSHMPIYEDSQLLDLKGDTISYNEHRKRKRLVLDILSSLKYLITEADARFIFIAGSEMFDAAIADVSDRDSAISSIFGHIINVDSLYKDYASVNTVGAGVSNLVENFLLNIIHPDRKKNDESLLSLPWKILMSDANSEIEDRLKIIYTLQHFVIYLTYRSTGSPKKLIRLFEEHVFQYDADLPSMKNIFGLVDNNGYKYKTGDLVLRLGYKDQYKIGLINYLYRPVIIHKSRVMKNYSNSMLVAVPYLMDHLIKFHSSAFSMESLELLPEVLSANRNPELRLFLEELIEIFKQNLLRSTDTRFFDYKFNYKIYNELVNLSTIYTEEGAAFNFTLDENYNIKVYLRLKIKELRVIYKDFGGDDSKSVAFDSIALYSIMLADVCFFDREYSDAIGAYSDAMLALRADNQPGMDSTLELKNTNFITYLRCLMKQGLCYEKIKAYDRSLGCYVDAMKLIAEYSEDEPKHGLETELHRLFINAYFSCLFIFEKKPSITSSLRHFDPIVIDIRLGSKRLDLEWLNNMSIYKFYSNKSNLVKLPELFGESVKSQKELLEDIITQISGEKDFLSGCLRLWDGYVDKSISVPDAHLAARTLSRLGNVLLTHLSDITIEGCMPSADIDFANAQNESAVRIKGNLDELKCLIETCKKDSEYIRKSNASDKLKYFVHEVSKDIYKYESNEIVLLMWIYTLSGKLYVYSGSGLMGSHQYRKILSIMRSLGPTLKEVLKTDYKEFLDFFSETYVTRCLQVASWISSSTDRAQFYKYKHALGLLSIEHPKSYSKFNYHATSNAPDIKEALWHYVVLQQIIAPEGIDSLEHLLKSPTQSFVHQGVVVHTMYARMNELQVQCVINHSRIHEIFSEEMLDSLISSQTEKRGQKKWQDKLDYWYFNYRNAGRELTRQDREGALFSGVKHYWNMVLGYLKTIFFGNGKLNDQSQDSNAVDFKEATYLIANWIYCLHNILLIMQMKGASYLITYSTMADQYRRLARVMKYYAICEVYMKTHGLPNVYDLTKELVGEDVIRGMDTTSLNQLATRYYRMAVGAHEGGSPYRYLISNMTFLEDDFHDNIFHFSIAFERQRINSGEILKHIRKLSNELGESQYFNYEYHVNGEGFDDEQVS